MKRSSAVGRIAAIVAIAAIAVVGVLLLLGGGQDPYEVTAEFENSSQLVKGNEVVVGGVATGSVDAIELGPEGQAMVTFTVDEQFAPLHRGTIATIRSYSLSGIANRQVQLTIPPESEAGPEIGDGGSLSMSETVSEVDLDQIFNTLDTETVSDLKNVIKGFETSYRGVGKQANRGLVYTNPFLSTSRRLFSELNSDEQALQQLVIDGSQLSEAVAERAPEVEALISNLDGMMSALASEKTALAESISKLPNFLRESNTTFVNLRAALDDVDPLVEASKPAARELQTFLPLLRRTAYDAVPTIRDLDAIVRRGGSDNDLVDLTRLQVPLNRSAVGDGSPDCGNDPEEDHGAAADGDFTQGAFGEATCALRNSTQQIGELRAYTPELVGWFDDFSHSGFVDAAGGTARVSAVANQTSVSDNGIPIISSDALSGAFENPLLNVESDQDNRCPGALEREIDGSTPFTDGGTLDCDPSMDPVGP